MATFQLPISASAQSLIFMTATRTFESPFTGSIQSVGRNADRWLINLQFNGVTGSRKAQMKAFILKLRGPANRFFTRDFDYSGARGTPTGTPLVQGASQSGSSLITDGWTPSTAIFKEGDEFQVGNFLKMITADVSSDGGGNATLSFEPQLHSSPANNAALDVTDPTGQFIMMDQRSGWSDHPDGSSTFNIAGLEDVLA